MTTSHQERDRLSLPKAAYHSERISRSMAPKISGLKCITSEPPMVRRVAAEARKMASLSEQSSFQVRASAVVSFMGLSMA